MKSALAAVCVVLLAASSFQAGGEKEKKPPERATIVYAAAMTGFGLVGEKEDRHELRLQGGRDPIVEAVYVEVPAKQSPGAGGSRELIGVEGTLKTKKVAVGMAGKNPITVPALLIEASKATILKDGNRDPFPPTGKAWIIGKLVEGKFPNDKGEPLMWAIANGDHPIVLRGNPPKLDAGTRVKVEGVLRVTGRGGFQLTIDRVEAVK